MEKQCYPKMIQKEGYPHMVVQNAYEHAHYYADGWSGPPEFGSAIPELEKEVERDKMELGEKEKRLAMMKDSQKKEEKDAGKLDSATIKPILGLKR